MSLRNLARGVILGVVPVGIAFVVALAPAAAKVMSATFTTTLTHGVDYTSYFGRPGVTNLAGQIVTIEFVYDSSAGVDASTATLLQRRGGSDYKAGLFILGTTVTIGGTALGVQSNNQQVWSVTTSSNPSTPGSVRFSTDDLVYELGTQSGALASRDSVAALGSGLGSGLVNGADLTKAGTYKLSAIDASIYLTAFNPPYKWSDARYNITAKALGPGTLVVRDITPQPVSAGPQTSTWALMLLGVCALGGLIGARRNRSRTAQAKQLTARL